MFNSYFLLNFLISAYTIFNFSSLARKAIRFCREKELIRNCGEQHHSQYVLTTTSVAKKVEEKDEKAEKQTKGKQQTKKGKKEAAEEKANENA